VKKLLSLFAAVLLISCLERTAWCVPTSYEVIDLSVLLGTGSSSAVDVNNKGQVIGQGPGGAFIYSYSSGTATYLSDTSAIAHGINNSGQVVGEASGTAFLYSGGTMSSLGSDTRAAYGINDSGQIVGYGNFVVNVQGRTADRGFVYNGGDITVLGTLTPSSDTNQLFTSYAYSINNNGQVVGKASYQNYSTYNAFLYANGIMTNLGTLGGTTSTANAVNNNEQIVGQAATSTKPNHAFLYDNGMTDLGNIIFNGCYATNACDINNYGQIVGNAVGLSSGSTSFLYDGSTMMDLNSIISSTNYYITSANAINDLGQIVATGKSFSNTSYYRALLLTPATRTWDGGGSDNYWNTPANWNPDTVPVNGSALIFSDVNRQTNINNTSLTSVGLVTFSNGGFNISGSPLILNAGIVSTGDNTWAIDSTLAFPQTFSSLSGTLTISGNVNNNGNLLTVDGPGNQLISGAISGTGGLTKSGTGTLTLSSTNNTYNGTTTVTGGVLEITGGINLGTTSLIDVEGGEAVLKTTNVNNSSLNIQTGTDATFQIADGIHTLGNIQGSGTTEVYGQLTANCICQDTLTIGSGGTIAPLPGGPLSESTQLMAVPEPAALILIITGILYLMYRRMGK
jgi:probable HAF family extracellular repeat protein/autotransporter-associated beta strand protein